MEGDDWPAQGDHALIHDSRPYQVQPRLVLWTTKVGGLTDLVGVANESASVNIAQPTGQEDGSALVTTYDWQEYFKTCTKVTGIKKLHHLRFDSAHPGCIFTKEKAGSTEVEVNPEGPVVVTEG